MIPGRDGYAVCEEIRSNPAWRDGRIMMLTAKGGDIQREKGLSLGADEYVTKPSPRASWSNGFAACSIGGIDHVARPDRDRIVGALFVGFAASAWLGLVPKQISAGDRTVL
jgi:CheY-like chemotaxis protein